MLKSLKLSSALIISLFCSATLVQADEQLIDGVRPFICDGEAIVFLETDSGWALSTDPTAEITSTDNGWRYEDPVSRGVWYLREESRNSWVIDGLSENGHFQADCIDLADSVLQVVTSIKPRLDENMMAQLTYIQAQLAESQVQLAEAEEELLLYNLAIQRVERLCIWMKTYRHLDVLDKSFPFGDQQYKLCN